MRIKWARARARIGANDSAAGSDPDTLRLHEYTLVAGPFRSRSTSFVLLHMQLHVVTTAYVDRRRVAPSHQRVCCASCRTSKSPMFWSPQRAHASS